MALQFGIERKFKVGKAVKSVGKVFGFDKGGSGPGPELDKRAFDLTEQAKRYENLLNEQRLYNQAANRQLTDQLQQQARGEGPLAGAQLRAAQNRNLAQTLAAAQAQNASPLATRNFLQMRGQSSRDLAELGQQERLQSQQALASQLAQQANISSSDIGQGFGLARAPVDMRADYEKQRFAGDVAKTEAIRQQQTAIGGALLSAAGQAGAAALGKSPTPKPGDGSDKNIKKDIKSGDAKVQAFLDALQAKQYSYKDPEGPGALYGKQVGILAQDLEKSSMGKALVNNTPDGKMLNSGQGFGAVLAAQANLNQRLKALEGKKKKT